MMLDFIIDLIGVGVEFVMTDWRPTRRQRVKRALRLARKQWLTVRRHEFALSWLAYGLAHVSELRLNAHEQEIRKALANLETAWLSQG